MSNQPVFLSSAPTVLHQVRVVDPVAYTDEVRSVLVTDDQLYVLDQEPLSSDDAVNAIALPDAIATTISLDDVVTLDAQGWVMGPGLVDLYSHSGEPGFESRETVATLAAAALAGGFTRLSILPNTQPVLDTVGAIAQLHGLAKTITPAPALSMWGALTQGLAGIQMTELAELAETGRSLPIAGLADGRAIQDPVLVQRLLEYAHGLDVPIALYPQSTALAAEGVAREGLVATQLGLAPQSAMAETAALSAIVDSVAATQTPVHIMRVSTAASVDVLYRAKEQGLPITASTTWMHLLLNSYALSQYDPNLRIDPPLGNPEDQAALILGLKSGILDAIAIDHTPYTYEEKTVPFALAPPGAIGLQCALPLLWQGLVEAGHLTAVELWRMLSTSPAHCLDQEAPQLSQEFVLFNPNQEWTVSADTLASLSANHPWIGETISGQVLHSHPRRSQPPQAKTVDDQA